MISSDKIKSVNIRNWQQDDFETIRLILSQTWKNTYTFIPEKDITSHLEKFYNQTELESLFTNKDVTGIIAEFDDRPAGFMKLFNDTKNERFYISSLYVLPNMQGYGIGKSLMKTAEKIAYGFEYDKIWLGVMEQNIKSLEWYKKSGFIFTEKEPFQMGTTLVQHLIGYKSLSPLDLKVV